MPLSEELKKKLNKMYEPLSTVEFKFRGKDVIMIVDKEGRAIQFFIGKKSDNGKIRGERYSRKLIRDRLGNLVKDHWDRKGKSS
jgi:hypothetical protein